MTRIVERIDSTEFRSLLTNETTVSEHALAHLSHGQRKIFKPADLIKTIEREHPVLVGRQRNERIAAYYRRRGGYLKIIIEQRERSAEIVTFMYTQILPNLRS